MLVVDGCETERYQGTAKDIAKLLNVSHRCVYQACKLGWKLKGCDIKLVGYVVIEYDLWKDNKLVMTGTGEEIANKFYVSSQAVYNAWKMKYRLVGEYQVGICRSFREV